MRSKAFEVNHPHPIRYILAASTPAEKNEWCEEIERLLTDIKEAEAKHEEAVLKISAQKASVAKNLIAASLMQHTVVGTNGGSNFRARMQNAKTPNAAGPAGVKSRTADPSTIRAYAEHMTAAKKSTKERWEEAKQTGDLTTSNTNNRVSIKSTSNNSTNTEHDADKKPSQDEKTEESTW